MLAATGGDQMQTRSIFEGGARHFISTWWQRIRGQGAVPNVRAPVDAQASAANDDSPVPKHLFVTGGAKLSHLGVGLGIEVLLAEKKT
jgi:hypothetical protein